MAISKSVHWHQLNNSARSWNKETVTSSSPGYVLSVTVVSMNSLQSRKILRVLCHAAALTSLTVVSIGVPIAAVILSDDELVKDSAREAINFSITVFLWAAFAGFLWFTIIGIPLAWVIGGLLGLASIILPLLAIMSVSTDEGRPYRYPFTLRLLKSPPSLIAHS